MPVPSAGLRRPLYDGDPRKLARWQTGAHAPPGIAVWELTLRSISAAATAARVPAGRANAS
jgi:hypothetical protein